MKRNFFQEEHQIYRDTVRRFIAERIVPFHDQWEVEGSVSREVWLEAGTLGYLCPSVPEQFGGSDAGFLYSMIVLEELARVGATGPGFHLHSEIIAPYILNYATDEQKSRWLPKMVRGECIGAIAMTEPGTGSDLQGITTRAEKKGDHYIVSGQKIFITNGQMADIVIVACKTSPERGSKALSLLVLERGMKGFERGKNLHKIGYKAQDTSELFFDQVEVPVENLLGEEGAGFRYLVEQLPQERLLVALRSVATMEAALEWTIDYVQQRQAFGRSIMSQQNTRFRLAEIKAQVVMARCFVDNCVERHLEGELDSVTAAIAKMQTTELLCSGLDQCLQLFGGYGYMWESPIARAWADARMGRIAGGTSEIMREIIGRSIITDKESHNK